jgi:hypothetical protein
MLYMFFIGMARPAGGRGRRNTMRLIDADKLKTELDAWARIIQNPYHYMRADALHIIDTAPEIDAVPVVRGEWIEHEDEMECPQCGYFWNYCDNDTERFNFCPNCGAKMESEGST